MQFLPVNYSTDSEKHLWHLRKTRRKDSSAIQLKYEIILFKALHAFHPDNLNLLQRNPALSDGTRRLRCFLGT